MTGHPLADDNAIASYTGPDPNRPELYDEAARVIRDFKGEYWIVGVTVTTIFETAWALRGYEQMLMDFVANPDLAEHILNIPYQYHLTAAKKLVEMGVDMIWTGDDVGMQTGMLISPKTWRKFLKPRMANFIASLKAINPQVKVAYHSDGNVSAIIPDLIEIGLDVLNPIQPACMDPGGIEAEIWRQAVLLGFDGRAAHAAVRQSARRSRRGAHAAQDDGQARRIDPRADAPRATRHADGEFLGDGQHHHPNIVPIFTRSIHAKTPSRKGLILLRPLRVIAWKERI